MQEYNYSNIDSQSWHTVSRKTACIITFIQLPITVYFLCRHRFLSVDTFTTQVQVKNDTTVILDYNNPITVTMMFNTNTVPFFTMCSFILTAFGFMSSQINDNNIIENMGQELYESNNENLKNNSWFTLWHALFAGVVAIHHVLYCIIVCSPFEVDTILLVTIPMLASLHAMYTKKVSTFMYTRKMCEQPFPYQTK